MHGLTADTARVMKGVMLNDTIVHGVTVDTAKVMRAGGVMLNGTTSPTFSAVDGFASHVCIAS